MSDPTSSHTSQSTLSGLILRVSGRWAHFKKPETNNNPLTHDFITKTALLGLMGAVLGVDRPQMRSFFPLWSDDFLYGVQVERAVKKESWSFTMRSASNLNSKAPKPMELLKEPSFLIALALQNERSREAFDAFARSVQQSRACYTPVLGLHNCAAEIEWLHQGIFEARSGSYQTRGFALREHGLDAKVTDLSNFRVGFERVPTFQNNDFWNIPDRYAEVIYPDGGRSIALKDGAHFRCGNDSQWCLI